MKQSTKRLLTLATCAVLTTGVCVGATACTKERGPNDILMWAGGQWVGSDADNLKAFVKWYNENNTIGVTVDLKIQTNFEQVFVGASMNNSAPDIMVWDRFNTPSYADSDVLESLDDLIVQDGIDATKFNATAYKEMSYGGHQYGLPLDLDLWGIYINMDIVNAYNEANPSTKITCLWDADGNDKLDWTWEEALDTAQKLKGFHYSRNGRDTVVQSGYDGPNMKEFFIHNYFSTGEDYINEQGKTEIDPVKGSDTLKYLYKLYRTGTSGYADNNAFLNGNLAMYMRSTYFTSYLNTYAQSMNVRFMPQPAYPGEGGDNRGVMGGYGMAIPRPTQDKFRTEAWEAKKLRCWDFMKDWLYNEEVMLKWAEISQTLPALLSTHDKTEVTGNKVLGGAIDFTNTYISRPSVPGWTSVQVNVFNQYVNTFCVGSEPTADSIASTLQTLKEETDAALESFGGIGN